MSDKPNPGSPEARALGCACPVQAVRDVADGFQQAVACRQGGVDVKAAEMLVGMRGVVTPGSDDQFHEFEGVCIGVRNGFLRVRDADDDVYEVEVSQFSPYDD